MTRQKRVAQNQQYRGRVCGPFNMLKDYTTEDMHAMREAGRRYAMEREILIMDTVITPKQIPLEAPKTVEKNPYGNNRKGRRALAAKQRKAKKQLDKIKKQVKPYSDPVGTRDDPQAVYDPRCYGE